MYISTDQVVPPRHLSYECTDRHVQKILCTRLFSAVLCEMAKDCKHPKYPVGLVKEVLLHLYKNFFLNGKDFYVVT